MLKRRRSRRASSWVWRTRGLSPKSRRQLVAGNRKRAPSIARAFKLR